MTPFRKDAPQYPHWKNRLKRGSLFVAVSALLVAGGCGSDNGSDWETVTVQEPTQGVITTISEKTDGSYEIIDEKVIPERKDSRVIVQRQSGKTDTMTLEAAKGLVSPQDTVATHTRTSTTINHHHHSSFGGVLWWGTMGYLMGRNMNTPSYNGIYRSGFNPTYGNSSQLRQTAISRTVQQPARSKSGFFRSFRGSSGG
ncbi:MAG: hypothetical protein J0L99_14160 [Chitinophagales bacterium]|nr:hypothetical protein [Chitinophagales bacterium]